MTANNYSVHKKTPTRSLIFWHTFK